MRGRERKRRLQELEKLPTGDMCRGPSSILVLRLGHLGSDAVEGTPEHHDRDTQSCSQLDRVRTMGRLVGDILYSLRARCRAGTNLLDIERWAQAMILAAGATFCDAGYASPFGHYIGRAATDEALHRAPCNYRLADDDLLTLELAIKKDGIVADSAISFIVSDELTEFSISADVLQARGRSAGTATGSGIDPAAAWPIPLSRQVARAVGLLRGGISRTWRVEDLADAVTLSSSQLARRFRVELGISPAAYLRQLRAERMAELLASTRLPVNEAARAVGWSNTTIAARAFKRRYGTTPRAFAAHARRIHDNGRLPQER